MSRILNYVEMGDDKDGEQETIFGFEKVTVFLRNKGKRL